MSHNEDETHETVNLSEAIGIREGEPYLLPNGNYMIFTGDSVEIDEGNPSSQEEALLRVIALRDDLNSEDIGFTEEQRKVLARMFDLFFFGGTIYTVNSGQAEPSTPVP